MTTYFTQSPIFCQVTDQVIDESIFIKQFSDQAHGALNVFIGKVRNQNQGKQVVSVAYEAHEGLAVKTFLEIAKESLKWDQNAKIAVIHRKGTLTLGEISIAIGVSSKHRDESYLMSRYIIEEIKVRSPIWKKEIYVDGQTDWVQGHALCGHSHRDHSVRRNVDSHGAT